MSNKFRTISVNWIVQDGFTEINSLTKPKFVTWEVRNIGDVVIFLKENVEVLSMTQDQWEELKRII